MKNIELGNQLYNLRIESGYSQEDIAMMLNITDGAVSKWENGESKPSTSKLPILAKIYGVKVNELLELINQKKEKQKIKIVLTGGPCAGKTTALNWINNYFSKRGYRVIFVSETATELISNGIAPWTCGSNYDYQTCQIKLQKAKEKVKEEAADSMKSDKILIVCDRGVLDNKAYMEEAEFRRLLKELKTNEIKERDSYDAVFHLVSAAKGKENVYTLANNIDRTETIDEARKLDDKIISAWTGHPHFRIIDNSTEFEEKLERLIKEIASFIGEPEPMEIERKYLIEFPNIKELEMMPNCTKVDITQTYLKTTDDTERRVRARGIDGAYLYYLTEKKKISNLKRIETERKLTQDEYINLLMEADNKLHTIHKTRYCLADNNQYFEIDIYSEWDKQAILEIELSSEAQAVIIPDYLKVIKEVTDDEEYKNYQMAKDMPKQLIKK